MANIIMKKISKDYFLGETVVHALKEIDFAVEKGEFVSIWGPSGSGKTTLLNIIGAIDQPSSGYFSIDNQHVAELSDNKCAELRNKSIGFVFQSFNLISVLTALENIMLPLEIMALSYSEARNRALSRLEEVGLSNFTHHRPDKLSGGQRQRVAIARALVTNPSLVIADEPTANLDSDTALSIIGLMRYLNEKENTTFIFSTHDQRLLEKVKRRVRLEDGQILSREDGI